MRNLLFIICVASVIGLLTGCGSSKPKCLTAVAVFSKDMPHVTSWEFTRRSATESVENIAFDIDVALEIVQSGCEKIQQTYSFTLPVDYCAPGNPAHCVADLLYQLAGISPSLKQLEDWSVEIGNREKELTLNTPVTLDGGFVIKVNEVRSNEAHILTLDINR